MDNIKNINKKETYSKILNTSRKLFIEQGYKKTTVRQIIKKADVTTGSFYHFFKNKDEVLSFMVLEVSKELRLKTKTVAVSYDKPLLAFTLEITINMFTCEDSSLLRELSLIAFKSSSTSAKINEGYNLLTEELFSKYNPHYSKDDYYLRVLAFRGIIYSFLAEMELANDYKIDFDVRLKFLLKSILNLYDLDLDYIDNLIDLTLTVVNQINLTFEDAKQNIAETNVIFTH